MNSRWSDVDAKQAVQRWGEDHGEDVALRLYTARLIGADPDLVLHGGGNVSIKANHPDIFGNPINALYIKASGTDLAQLDIDGLPAFDLSRLQELASLASLDDVAMVHQFTRASLVAGAPMPSIETLVHAFLPHKYVDHSHADALLALTNLPEGEGHIRAAARRPVAILPYVRPGFELAQALAKLLEDEPDVEGVILMQHGLITFADTARKSYERHIAIVDDCEQYLAERCRDHRLTPALLSHDDPARKASVVAPLLRGMLALPTGDEDRPHRRLIMDWRATDPIMEVLNSDQVTTLAQSGPLTGDHVIHTKPRPLLLAGLNWSNLDALRADLKARVDGFAERYRAYAASMGDRVGDDRPRVIWMPGAGLFAFSRDKKHARQVADLAEHTLLIKARAAVSGPFLSLSDDHLLDLEYRAIQRRKLDAIEQDRLAGEVVFISGGAGAIGYGIADECLSAGAHVVLADIDVERAQTIAKELLAEHGTGRVRAVAVDVTDEASVRAALGETLLVFGGVDVIVPNAGVAHVAPIDELATEDFRRVLDVNATGYLNVIREGAACMKMQGLGGSIVIVSSKNVFAPGKSFGAYSASKAAGHQLGRVAALDLAPHGIRVNMINADGVFGDEEHPSGLWREVGPARARSRDMNVEDLPAYYRDRNLLRTGVRAHHVGRAVVFFASHATPTTGATFPVDGGLPDAFPR